MLRVRYCIEHKGREGGLQSVGTRSAWRKTALNPKKHGMKDIAGPPDRIASDHLTSRQPSEFPRHGKREPEMICNPTGGISGKGGIGVRDSW